MKFIHHIQYICTPRDISLHIENRPKTGRTLVTFYIDTVEAFSFDYRLTSGVSMQYYDDLAKGLCTTFFEMLTEDEFADKLPDDDYLKGIYVHRKIQSLGKKSGTVVWKRNINQ